MESEYPSYLDTLSAKKKEYFLNYYKYVKKNEKNDSLETWVLYYKNTGEYYAEEHVYSDRIKFVLPNGSSATSLIQI